MRYFGGKARTASKIVTILESLRKPNQVFVEPFLGGANILSKMSGERMGLDASKYLIELYQALQDGWEPPSCVSEELYYKVKSAKDEELPMGLKAFVGFGCSYAGKWFGGYCRDGTDRNYALNAKNSLYKKMETMKSVAFIYSDYREVKVKDCLIYCDPPYEGFTGYGAVGDFNSNEFWDYMRKWSHDNIVVASEYNSPLDFNCIAEFPTKLDIRNQLGEKEARVEKLFMYRGID